MIAWLDALVYDRCMCRCQWDWVTCLLALFWPLPLRLKFADSSAYAQDMSLSLCFWEWLGVKAKRKNKVRCRACQQRLSPYFRTSGRTTTNLRSRLFLHTMISRTSHSETRYPHMSRRFPWLLLFSKKEQTVVRSAHSGATLKVGIPQSLSIPTHCGNIDARRYTRFL